SAVACASTTTGCERGAVVELGSIRAAARAAARAAECSSRHASGGCSSHDAGDDLCVTWFGYLHVVRVDGDRDQSHQARQREVKRSNRRDVGAKSDAKAFRVIIRGVLDHVAERRVASVARTAHLSVAEIVRVLSTCSDRATTKRDLIPVRIEASPLTVR